MMRGFAAMAISGHPVRIATCLAVYLVSQWFAFQLTVQPENIAIFWPPAGVMLACFLAVPRSRWTILASLFFGATVLANWVIGRSPGLSAALSLNDVAVGLVGAWIYSAHARAAPTLETRRNLTLLLAVACASALLSASVGATITAIAFGAPYWAVWRLWAPSMVLGILLTTPPLLAWTRESSSHDILSSWLETGLAAVLVIGAAALVYLFRVVAPAAGGGLIYLPLPILLWVALRRSHREATLAVFVTAAIAIWGAVHGRILGDLATTESHWRGLSLQADLTILATTTLFLAAATAERRRAEASDRDHTAALIESETRFRNLVEANPDAVLVVEHGRIVYANPAAIVLLGATRREALLEWPMERIDHPTSAVITTERTRLVLAEDRAAPLTDGKWLRVDGSEIDVEVTSSPLLWEGRPALQVIARDVTAKKAAERELHERDRLIQSILETTTAAVITTDQRGVIQAANPGAERIFGYTMAELLGANISLLTPSEHRDRHDDYLQRYFQTGKASIIGTTRIVSARRKDGSTFPAELSVGETMQRGEPIFTGFMRDVTAREKAQQRIEALQAELDLIARRMAMGEFASVLAHELTQPLAALTNYAGAARELARSGTAGDPGLTSVVDKIIQQASRAGEVVRRVRRLVERRAPECAAEDPHSVIAEAIELALIGRNEPPITIDHAPAADLPAVAIDRIQVQQVLINLIRNAAEAMRLASRRVLSIDIARHGGKEIVISVGDTGRGIPGALADRLFEPFFSTSEDGMGIGLAICRSIVEAHGGRLWFEPITAGGTVFRFTLPIAEPPGDRAN